MRGHARTCKDMRGHAQACLDMRGRERECAGIHGHCPRMPAVGKPGPRHAHGRAFPGMPTHVRDRATMLKAP